MEKSPEEMVQGLIANGIPEAIATSMVNSMLKAEKKTTDRKKRPAFFSSNPKHEITLIHEDTCQTCGAIVSEKHVTWGYDDEDGTTVKGVRSLCHNCPKYLDSLPKEVLISLFMIQNNHDPVLHMLPNKMQIRLAHEKPAAEWVGKKIVRQDMSIPEYEKK